MTNMCKAKKDIEAYGVVKGSVFSYEITERGTYKLSHGERCTKNWFDEHYEIINNIEATNNTMNTEEATTMNITKVKETYNTKRRAIKCIETGNTYISIVEAAREMNLNMKTISNVLHGRQKAAKGYHFEYLSEEETKALLASIEPKDIVLQKHAIIKGKGKCFNGNTNAVLCISTGEVYTSCTDAAMSNNTTVGSMSSVCRGRSYTTKGKKFCYVKDINEHLDEVAESIRKANMYDELMTKEEKRKELIAEVDKRKAEVNRIEGEIENLHYALKAAYEELEKAKETLMYFI